MRKMMNKVAGNMKVTTAKAAMLLKDKKGENYVDTAVKILIAVVIGALLLAGLYAYPYQKNAGNVQLCRLIPEKEGGREYAQKCSYTE